MAFSTAAWDETKPAGSRARALGDDDIREHKEQSRERLSVDHDFRSDESGAEESVTPTGTIGYHKKVTLTERASDPANVANTGILYTKEVSSVTELFFEDSAGTVKQLTTGGLLNIAATEAVLLTGAQTIAGVKTFSDTPKTDAIAEASAAAGVTVDGCLIKDGQVADADTVDGIEAASTDLKPLGSWTSKTSGTTYQATTDGFAVGYAEHSANNVAQVTIETDGSNPPTTIRARNRSLSASSNYASASCLIKKNDYYKITTVGSSKSQFFIPLGS